MPRCCLSYLIYFLWFTEALETERKKESQVDSVETYQEAFEKIKAMTGEDDLDLLVHKFIEVEDKNFALFNYVNEQNNEIESINDAIQEVGFCFTSVVLDQSPSHTSRQMDCLVSLR